MILWKEVLISSEDNGLGFGVNFMPRLNKDFLRSLRLVKFETGLNNSRRINSGNFLEEYFEETLLPVFGRALGLEVLDLGFGLGLGLDCCFELDFLGFGFGVVFALALPFPF
jgi:hypothetical protein